MDAKTKAARWEAILAKTPPAIKAAMRKVNEKSAIEQADQVHAIIPRDGGHEDGPLADTVRVAPVGELGFQVSIGDAQHRYPLHLEAGHLLVVDGKPAGHVAGKAYWNPVQRLVKKRHRGRVARAISAANKKLAAGG